MAGILLICLASLFICIHGKAGPISLLSGLNWGQAWASINSSAAGVISGSTLGNDNFSDSHGGNSGSGKGGKGGSVMENTYGTAVTKNKNKKVIGEYKSPYALISGLNWGQAWASDGSMAAGVISGSTWGNDNNSVAHGGKSGSSDGGKGGSVKRNNYGRNINRI